MQTHLTEELDLLDQLVKHHLKSYQVWYVVVRSFHPLARTPAPADHRVPISHLDRQHRRTIVLALDDPSRELDFTAKALALDSKNYHTWAYRQWVLMHFWAAPSTRGDRTLAPQVWEGEIAYADKLLQEDLRNNSAWNHRFFIAFESGTGGDCDEREIR